MDRTLCLLFGNRHGDNARWMRPDDFFIHPDPGPFGDLDPVVFNIDLIREIRSGPISDADDVEVAVALARLVHDELEAFGTGGGEELEDGAMREAILALRAVTDRLGIVNLDIPLGTSRRLGAIGFRKVRLAPGRPGETFLTEFLNRCMTNLRSGRPNRSNRIWLTR